MHLVADELLTRLDISLLGTWLDDLHSLGYRFPPLLKHKPYVYLIQGTSRNAIPNLEETINSDIFFLTFYQKTGNIFLPKSTFNEGRNALLRHALAMEQTPGYEYFIFVDDDVDLVTVKEAEYFWKEDMEENPWRRFEQFLQKFAPSVGFAQYSQWRQVPESEMYGPVSITTTSDESMMAYQRDTLNILLPTVEALDKLSFWNGAVVKYFLIKVFYSQSSLQCNSLLTKNTRLVHDDTGSIYTIGINTGEVYQFLKDNLRIQPNNPLYDILEQMKNYTGFKGGKLVNW